MPCCSEIRRASPHPRSADQFRSEASCGRQAQCGRKGRQARRSVWESNPRGPKGVDKTSSRVPNWFLAPPRMTGRACRAAAPAWPRSARRAAPGASRTRPDASNPAVPTARSPALTRSRRSGASSFRPRAAATSAVAPRSKRQGRPRRDPPIRASGIPSAPPPAPAPPAAAPPPGRGRGRRGTARLRPRCRPWRGSCRGTAGRSPASARRAP